MSGHFDPIAFLTIATASLSGVLSPGPMFAMTIATSSKFGFKAGPLVSLGHVVVEAPLIIALWLGLGELLKHHLVDVIMSALGALILIYLGLSSILIKTSSNKVIVCNPFVGGVITTALNPLFIAWWIALAPLLISLVSPLGSLGLIVLLSAHCPLDVMWCSTISAFVAKGRKALGRRGLSAITKACGLILLAFGAYFIVRLALLLAPIKH